MGSLSHHLYAYPCPVHLQTTKRVAQRQHESFLNNLFRASKCCAERIFIQVRVFRENERVSHELSGLNCILLVKNQCKTVKNTSNNILRSVLN